MTDSPILFLHERYTPRSCAAPDCPEPPCATYMAATTGVLFGQATNAGQAVHVCRLHEQTAEAEAR